MMRGSGMDRGNGAGISDGAGEREGAAAHARAMEHAKWARRVPCMPNAVLSVGAYPAARAEATHSHEGTEG
jgi:hypothetical protein